jgi:Na+:H+ antiporter
VHLELTPQLILALFVPPLVFEAAFHLQIRSLRLNALPILALAVVGVLLTTALVGFIVRAALNVSLTTALVFGALISATDPVSVVALFRALGAPRRLALLVEGESLFNDGTAIVVFNLMLAAALAQAGDAGVAHAAFSLPGAVISFVKISVGGAFIGIGLGWIAAQLIARVDDYLIETTITTVLAFGAYLVAERFHVSGVLAVVTAGIVNGNIGPRGMSPTTRIVLFNFWEYLAFAANSLVFLLIGLDVNVPQLLADAKAVAVGVVAVLAGRALVVYGLSWLVNRGRERVERAYQHVLFWGGLRGAISLALVLSLPVAFADRELLRVMTFGVVLFTLLGQGTTMNLLLKRLGLIQRAETELEYERRHARLITARAAHERLRQLHETGAISGATWEELAPGFQQRTQDHLEAERELLAQHPQLQHEERQDALREGLRAQRAMLGTLLSEGIISEAVFDELAAEVDRQLEFTTLHLPAAAPDPAPSAPTAG